MRCRHRVRDRIGRSLSIPLACLLAWLPALLCAQAPDPATGAAVERLLAAPERDWPMLAQRPELATAAVASALVARGDRARLAAEFARATALYAVAADVARRAGAGAVRGAALNGSADAWFRQGDHERALAAAREAVALHEQERLDAGLAQAWNTIGNVHQGRAEYRQALACYEKSLALRRPLDDRRGMAQSLNNVGMVHKGLGAFGEALERFTEALALFEALGDARSAAVVADNIGVVHFHRGEYGPALEYAQRSLEANQALEHTYGIAKSLDTLGNIHRAKGAYARALACFLEALALRETMGARHSVAETANNIGLVYVAQGEYARAVTEYRRALRLNAAIGDKSLSAEALLNLGAAAWLLGQRTRAEANFRASLAIAEREGFDHLTAETLHGLGEMAAARGRLAAATPLLARALALRERVRDQAGITATVTAIAAVQLAAGRPSDAADTARRAVQNAEAHDQPDLLWEAQTVAGMAYRRLGRRDEARRILTDAVAGVEQLRRHVAGRAESRARFLERRLSPYHELVALAAQNDAPREALEMAERARARALAELLAPNRREPSVVMSADERARERQLRGALLSANERVHAARIEATPDPDRLRRLVAEQRARRAEFEAFQQALAERHADLARDRGETAPFAWRDALDILPPDSTAVLEYVVAGDEARVIVVTRSDGTLAVDTHRLAPDPRTLAAVARRFRQRIGARDPSFGADARLLYRWLLAPVRERIAGRAHLLVVPDGDLWHVPFQALQDADGRFVVESAAVTYAPSLTVLREIARRPASPRPRRVLAMGKADFGPADARPAPVRMSELAPLPEAEHQVTRIVAAYGASRTRSYLGPDATEARFKAEAPHHTVLHLATHGVLDEATPLYSHVVLTPGGSEAREDGLLEAWEIMTLRLDADVVVLSACETGRGRVAPGEGIVGMMWALFAAGARSMVVSHWQVEATSTAEMMARFHRGLASERGSAGEHLRAASLDLLRSPRFAHPFYWAGFLLVGQPI